MKKIQPFLLAATLVLVTAVTFAGVKRFTSAPLYVSTFTAPTAAQVIQITSSVAFAGLTETGTTNQVTLRGTASPSTVYYLFDLNGGVYKPIFSSGW